MSGALGHLKVLDLGWVIAVPMATKVLAEHGAIVIRVESATRPDLARSNLPNVGEPGINRCAFFAAYNNDKYGLTLNLGHPGAASVVERLVRWADVVVENFRAGTLERLGMSPEELQRINPGVTVIRSTLFGQHGPNRDVAGFGQTMQALTGLTGLVGWPDRPPSGSPVPYPDFLSPWWVIALVMAGLAQRRSTGKGSYFDLSQVEASLNFLTPWLMEHSVTGSARGAGGNRDPHAAPHGVFPCVGDDKWCAVAVTDELEWGGLVNAMGRPGWALDLKFDHGAGRKAHESELEILLSKWTSTFTPGELMNLLQEHGVPAGEVLDGEGLHRDPQLAHRKHFVSLEHAEMGLRTYDSPSFRLSRQPASLARAAHCLGEHNEEICLGFLGMTEDEFADLLIDGVLE